MAILKMVSFIDIIKALCPGGSITGAPKESSMKIIDLLESIIEKYILVQLDILI